MQSGSGARSVGFVSPTPLATVEGAGITHATLAATVEAVADQAEAGRSFTVFTLNLDHVVKLRRDRAFRSAYARATVVTADGAPVVWLARRQHSAIERATGADLVVPLAREAARRRLSVFLFGSSDAVLARAGAHLAAVTGHTLDIVGTEAPPRGFDPEGPVADAALERIARSGARLCFLALGAPKQELFAARAQARGIPAGFVCIGAGLDFLAGHQSRAPQWMQRHGLEWVWRLGSDPRRLARRYADCAVALADVAVIAPARRRLSRGRAVH
jgi:exopolysaccharide biosynthesis WecB/TagA/CpsF family protein